MGNLSREGFRVVFYDTLEDFYLAEALEYVAAWRQSTPDNPVGICGPIGPTEQLPLVARLVNELGQSLNSAHFWGMDEWWADGREVPMSHPSRSSVRTANSALAEFGPRSRCRRPTFIFPRWTYQLIGRRGREFVAR
jgi:hypothetical protein